MPGRNFWHELYCHGMNFLKFTRMHHLISNFISHFVSLSKNKSLFLSLTLCGYFSLTVSFHTLSRSLFLSYTHVDTYCFTFILFSILLSFVLIHTYSHTFCSVLFLSNSPQSHTHTYMRICLIY